MKWKLILSFSAVAFIFLGVALYQGYKINQVETSMVTQKREMEIRVTVATMTQLLQEINNLEASLTGSGDLELVNPLKDKHRELKGEVAKVQFAEGAPAQESLLFLQSQLAEYNGLIDSLIKTMKDDSLDPMALLEQSDKIHTDARTLNAAMLTTNKRLYAAAAENAEAAQSYSFQLLDHTSSISLYAAVLVLLFTVIIAGGLIRSFVLPVNKLQAAVRQIAEGDLRQQIRSPYNDELGQLSHHFDHMVERVRDMLMQTRSVASSLARYSGSFRQSSEITAYTNQEIVQTIQEIAAGADSQAGQSERSAALIRELEQEVQEITEYTEMMLSTSNTANQNTQKGSAAVTSLREASVQSRMAVSKVYEALQKLARQAGDISRITDSITEISKQTNILSLNASIEAARAGAHGKGFAVIADEVRQLSLQTKESSAHISEIMGALQQGMDEFQGYMLETRGSLEEQDVKAGETLVSFEAIDRSMLEISKQIGQIHEKVDVAQTVNSRLAESVHSVAAIAEETAAGVQEVNASSMQQDHAIRDIARQATEIDEISQKLFQEIHVFKLDSGTEEAGPVADSDSEPEEGNLPQTQIPSLQAQAQDRHTVLADPATEKQEEAEAERPAAEPQSVTLPSLTDSREEEVSRTVEESKERELVNV
ncbi:methyl-accepting chemotaxis protein [Paenibacillus albidus]|uniref:methyl-accepting chemotaxis protein n=1 Tax=Paenibacillus albidus TaxID=2041023 RepID=UPI001BE67792|nr:methyl-accepting chemotaxis protein [Paenibacillus albidus]MBT2293111.1 methyl-accepting chemotaxis protein [Paenibacillus albidus]